MFSSLSQKVFRWVEVLEEKNKSKLGTLYDSAHYY